MAAETRAEPEHRAIVRQERWQLLHHVVSLTCTPMTILSFIWVGLIILNLVQGLPLLLQRLELAIWILFVLNFVAQVIIAPHKLEYVRVHWLTVLSLFLPAFGVLRILRAVQLVRMLAVSGSFSLLGIITACNRGMVAIRRVMGRWKVGYVATLTGLIILAGAAGMYSFENPASLTAAGYGSAVHGGAGLHSYAEAVWWTAMVMTTMGSAYWPLTLAGRILCFLLALYAFAVFGYITATIASYFVGGADQAAQEAASDAASANASALQAELAALRQQMELLVSRLDQQEPDGRPPVVTGHGAELERKERRLST